MQNQSKTEDSQSIIPVVIQTEKKQSESNKAPNGNKTTPTPITPTSSKSRLGSVTSEDGSLLLDKMSRDEIIELFIKQRQVTLRYKGRFAEVCT